MKNLNTMMVISALVCTAATTTSASELQLMQGALEGRNAFIQAGMNRDFTQIFETQMSNVIEEFALDLESRNDLQGSEELRSIWTESAKSLPFLGHMLSQKDLGDHSPAFPALEDFLTRMTDRYGAIILSLPYVQDLRTLNFAVAVVFRPMGTGWTVEGVDARIEYRKHFIPFANLVTYYASFYGCKTIATRQGIPQAARLCRKAAEKLRFAMGRYIAPVISDFVFKSARRVTRRPRLSQRQLVYTRSEQLLNEIKGESL